MQHDIEHYRRMFQSCGQITEYTLLGPVELQAMIVRLLRRRSVTLFSSSPRPLLYQDSTIPPSSFFSFFFSSFFHLGFASNDPNILILIIIVLYIYIYHGLYGTLLL